MFIIFASYIAVAQLQLSCATVQMDLLGKCDLCSALDEVISCVLYENGKFLTMLRACMRCNAQRNPFNRKFCYDCGMQTSAAFLNFAQIGENCTGVLQGNPE